MNVSISEDYRSCCSASTKFCSLTAWISDSQIIYASYIHRRVVLNQITEMEKQHWLIGSERWLNLFGIQQQKQVVGSDNFPAQSGEHISVQNWW